MEIFIHSRPGAQKPLSSKSSICDQVGGFDWVVDGCTESGQCCLDVAECGEGIGDTGIFLAVVTHLLSNISDYRSKGNNSEKTVSSVNLPSFF